MMENMSYRKLTNAIEVSAIGFGGAALSGKDGGYGFGEIDDERSNKLIAAALNLGINIFDSAPIYGFGQSEKRIGQYLRANPEVRKDIVLVTKGGITWDDNRYARIDNSPDIICRSIDQSLVDLQTNVIDVYMIHWPDPKVELEKSLKPIIQAKSEGKIRSIGVCNFSLPLLKKAQEFCNIEVIQNDFSVFNSSNIELIEYCHAEDIGFMGYGTLAKGMLAGTATLDRKYDEKDHRSHDKHMISRLSKLKEHQKRYLDLAKEAHSTPSALAVAWALSKQGVSTVLCGCKNEEQLKEVAAGTTCHPVDPAFGHIFGILDELSVQTTPDYYDHA